MATCRYPRTRARRAQEYGENRAPCTYFDFVNMHQRLYSARVDYDYEHDYDQEDVFSS
jgi:hypothetical protein